MNAGQSSSQHEAMSASRLSPKQRAFLSIGLTVVVSLAAIVFVGPNVGPWLEVRSAYGNLSSTDPDTRIDAIHRLRRLGEETASALIVLLHHPDEGVRRFAASELAHRTRLTADVIEAFLIALESNQHVAEIDNSAPKLIVRHAEDATGPLTETDRRMIAWLKTELNSTNPDMSGQAAWAMTAFVNRAPSLQAPLDAYLKNGTFYYKYVVLREMADSDPSMLGKYVDVLLSGLCGTVYNDQMNALHGLANLKNKPVDLRARLEARREQSTNPEEISRIDQALEELRMADPAQP